jgi:hypothetical protein
MRRWRREEIAFREVLLRLRSAFDGVQRLPLTLLSAFLHRTCFVDTGYPFLASTALIALILKVT